MHHAVTVLTRQGSGPIEVETDDGAVYGIELDGIRHEEDGFHATGRDRAVDDVLYRIEAPIHDGGDVTLERRHARDEEWTDLGRVVEVDELSGA